MSSLNSFFEPIRESTVFGNQVEHPQPLAILDTEVYDSDEVHEEKDVEMDAELVQINESIQRAKLLVEESLISYHTWKDEEREHTRLKDLLGTTLDDMVLRLEFLADAFTKRFPESTVSPSLEEVEDQLRALRASMMKPIQEKLNMVQKEVASSKRTLHTLANFVNLSRQLSGKNMCPICYQQDVDVYCDPCGHTFCQKCVKANYCYLCRTKIQKVQKLYFT